MPRTQMQRPAPASLVQGNPGAVIWLEGERVESVGGCPRAVVARVPGAVERIQVNREAGGSADGVELGSRFVVGGLASILSDEVPSDEVETIQEVNRCREARTVDLRSAGFPGGGDRLLFLVERDGGRPFLAFPVS